MSDNFSKKDLKEFCLIGTDSFTQARQKLMSSGKMRTSALCLNEFILNILSIKLKKVFSVKH
jgi:hypothetical protein